MFQKKIDNYPRIENYHSPKNKKDDKIQQGEQPRKREFVLFCTLVALSAIILLAIILSTLFLQLFQQNTSSTSGTQAVTTTTAIPTTTTVTTTGSTTTTTTTSTTTTPYVPTYNEACNTTCRSGTGLTCNAASVCRCTPSQYWSYGSSSCQTCQSGWTGYMDFCWRIFNISLTRNNAEAYCNSLNLNASLPNFDSDQKYIYMRSKYEQSPYNSFWLWPSTAVPMVFKWKNGQTVKEGYYDTPDPNNSGGTDSSVTEGCLITERWRKFRFIDISCSWTGSSTYIFSCEYMT